ncbi:MAG: TIGR00730 family Rossman fold protein [Rhodobacteraceae bacterium]|nr:TIGR00730 family Rossman fold protein [Paracoccaceae bacterium]
MPATPPSICVFCGSRDGDDPAYSASAEALGHLMAREGWRLVYGAGDVGMMGQVARAAQGDGGATFGVIPVHLMAREVGKRDLSQFVITENMHERKKVMYMNADAIVTLPGGAGSLDEFFEVMTWRQLGLHKKPIYLLNINGYWDPLVALIEHMIAHGFAEAGFRDYMSVVSGIDDLAAALRRDFSRRQVADE